MDDMDELIRRYGPIIMLFLERAAMEHHSGGVAAVAETEAAEAEVRRAWSQMPPVSVGLAEFARLSDFVTAALSSKRARELCADKAGVPEIEDAASFEESLLGYVRTMMRVNPKYASLAKACEISPQFLDRMRQAIKRAKGLRDNAVAAPMAACWAIYPLWLCDDNAGPNLLARVFPNAGNNSRGAWRTRRCTLHLHRRSAPGIILRDGIAKKPELWIKPGLDSELRAVGANMDAISRSLQLLNNPPRKQTDK